MPYRITKNKDGSYKVSSPNGTRMQHGSRADAEAQVRLLRGIEYGNFKPTKKKGR